MTIQKQIKQHDYKVTLLIPIVIHNGISEENAKIAARGLLLSGLMNGGYRNNAIKVENLGESKEQIDWKECTL